MKTKVIIENGYTEIILTPENLFEKDLIDNIENLELSVRTENTYALNTVTECNIVIEIKDKNYEGFRDKNATEIYINDKRKTSSPPHIIKSGWKLFLSRIGIH